MHDRTMLVSLLRRQPPVRSAWKQEKYMRGALEAAPFFS